MRLNPDERIRRLERRWRASGDLEDEVVWLAARLRAGEFSPGNVIRAATFGFVPAILLAERADLGSPRSHRELMFELSRRGKGLCMLYLGAIMGVLSATDVLPEGIASYRSVEPRNEDPIMFSEPGFQLDIEAWEERWQEVLAVARGDLDTLQEWNPIRAVTLNLGEWVTRGRGTRRTRGLSGRINTIKVHLSRALAGYFDPDLPYEHSDELPPMTMALLSALSAAGAAASLLNNPWRDAYWGRGHLPIDTLEDVWESSGRGLKRVNVGETEECYQLVAITLNHVANARHGERRDTLDDLGRLELDRSIGNFLGSSALGYPE